MPTCERCQQQPGRYCRECLAEHLYTVHLVEEMQVRFRGDVTHLSFAMLAPAKQQGWRAVADAVREMQR